MTVHMTRRMRLLSYKNKSSLFSNMLFALAELVTGIVTNQDIFYPKLILDDLDGATGNAALTYGRTNVYKEVGSKIQVNVKGNWVDCFDKPTAGAWDVEDIDEQKTVLINYRETTPGEKAESIYTANDMLIFQMTRYVKTESGCTVDYVDEYQITEAKFDCTVKKSNIPSFDSKFSGITIKDVGIGMTDDNVGALFYGDITNGANQYRIMGTVRLTDPVQDGSCYGVAQTNTDKIIAMPGGYYEFRLFDKSNRKIELINMHPAFSSVGWQNFGSDPIKNGDSLDGLTNCVVPGIADGDDFKDFGTSMDAGNQYEGFVASKDKYTYISGTDTNCVSKSTPLPNIVLAYGQQAVTYDPIDKKVKFHYAKNKYDSDTLIFEPYLGFSVDSENDFDVYSIQNKIVFALKVGTRVRIYHFIAIEPLPTVVGGDYLYNSTLKKYSIVSSFPSNTALVPMYDTTLGLAITTTFSATYLQFRIVNSVYSFDLTLDIKPVNLLAADPKYTAINSLNSNNLTATVKGSTRQVEFKLSSANYLALSDYYGKSASVYFPTCDPGACSFKDSSLLCALPEDYSKVEYTGSVNINIGGGDIIKNVPMTINAGEKMRVIIAQVSAPCNAQGKDCEITINGENLGTLETSQYNPANLPPSLSNLAPSLDDFVFDYGFSGGFEEVPVFDDSMPFDPNFDYSGGEMPDYPSDMPGSPSDMPGSPSDTPSNVPSESPSESPSNTPTPVESPSDTPTPSPEEPLLQKRTMKRKLVKRAVDPYFTAASIDCGRLKELTIKSTNGSLYTAYDPLKPAIMIANGIEWKNDEIKFKVDEHLTHGNITLKVGTDTIIVAISNPTIRYDGIEDTKLIDDKYSLVSISMEGFYTDKTCIIKDKKNPKNCKTAKWSAAKDPIAGITVVNAPSAKDTDRFPTDPIQLKIAKDFSTVGDAKVPYTIIFQSFDSAGKLELAQSDAATINLNITNTFDPFIMSTNGFLNTTIKHDEIFKNDTSQIAFTFLPNIGNAGDGIGEIGVSDPDGKYGVSPALLVSVITPPKIGYLAVRRVNSTAKTDKSTPMNYTVGTPVTPGDGFSGTYIQWNYDGTYTNVLNGSHFPLSYELNVTLLRKSLNATEKMWQTVKIQMDVKCINKKFINTWGGVYQDANNVTRLDLCAKCLDNGRCFADPKDVPLGIDGTYPLRYTNGSMAFTACSPLDACNGSDKCNEGYTGNLLFI